MADGKPISKGPYGTPTAWFENGRWYLFYERGDRAVWLAESKDLKVFTNVQDEPVLVPGPGEYDRKMIALNQVIKYDGRYYACYHGSPGGAARFLVQQPGRVDGSHSLEEVPWQPVAAAGREQVEQLADQ